MSIARQPRQQKRAAQLADIDVLYRLRCLAQVQKEGQQKKSRAAKAEDR